MRIDKFMTPADKMVTCGPDSTVLDAARLVEERRVGCVVVVEEGDGGVLTPVGLVTKTDIVRVVAAGKDAAAEKVASHCSRGIHSIAGERSRDDAAELMLRERVHHLVVTGGDAGALVGVISSYDVAREAALDAKAWPYSREAAFFHSGF